MFKKDELKKKLDEHGITFNQLAVTIGCNEATLYRKMNGSSDFSRNEIQLMRQALGLSPADIDVIFFA